MEKSDIKLNLRIEIPQKHRFNDADICVILGNCLDNSIEAVCKLDDVSKREVNVDLVSKYNGAMNISTDNSMFKVQILLY